MRFIQILLELQQYESGIFYEMPKLWTYKVNFRSFIIHTCVMLGQLRV